MKLIKRYAEADGSKDIYVLTSDDGKPICHETQQEFAATIAGSAYKSAVAHLQPYVEDYYFVEHEGPCQGRYCLVVKIDHDLNSAPGEITF